MAHVGDFLRESRRAETAAHAALPSRKINISDLNESTAIEVWSVADCQLRKNLAKNVVAQPNRESVLMSNRADG